MNIQHLASDLQSLTSDLSATGDGNGCAEMIREIGYGRELYKYNGGDSW